MHKDKTKESSNISFKNKYPVTIKFIGTIIILFLVSLTVFKTYQNFDGKLKIEKEKIGINDLLGTYLGHYSSFEGVRLEINDYYPYKSTDEYIPLQFSIIGQFEIISRDTLFIDLSNNTIRCNNDKFKNGYINRNNNRNIYLTSDKNNKISWYFEYYKKLE